MRFRLFSYILFFLAIAWLTVVFIDQIIDSVHLALAQIEQPDSVSFTAYGPESSSIFLPVLLNGPPLNPLATKIKVLASDGNASDHFGSAVSLSHNSPSSDMMALIGAPFDNENGAAYLYRSDGLSWIEEAKLSASDGASDERFGSSVSLNGEWAIVGAPGEFQTGVGAAYLFHWNGSTWQQEAKLLDSDAIPYDNFGRAVSLSGNVALVGSRRLGYIYRFNGESWQEEAKLEFGPYFRPEDDISISLNGDLALVGGHRTECEQFGCYPMRNMANVYHWNGLQWSRQGQLPISGLLLPTVQQAVRDVATNGEQVLIGMGGNAILYSFDADNWQQEAKFEPSDGVVSSFGESVALSEDKVLIGQYLYHWNGSEWIEEAKLGFGNASPTSLSDDIVLVGSPSNNDYGSSSGAAYFYHLSPENGPKVTLSTPHIQRTLNMGEHTITELTITNHSTDTLSWQASISDTTWLNMTPTFGTLMPNQSHLLSVRLDAAALEMGDYTNTVGFTMDPPLLAALETSVRLTVLPAKPTPTATFVVAGVSLNLDSSCIGHYIQGSVLLPNGAPVPGISIIAQDRYGNTFQALSKVDGLYDIPISNESNIFQVSVTNGPTINIEHTDDLAQLPRACHIVNWQFTP